MTSDFNLPSDLPSVWSSDTASPSLSTDSLPAEFGDSNSTSSPIQTHKITPKTTPSELSVKKKLAVIPEENSGILKKLTAEKFTDEEKFEMLSAYLDDEASESEHCLVEYWLANELTLQQQYQAQLKLRKAMRLLALNDATFLEA